MAKTRQRIARHRSDVSKEGPQDARESAGKQVSAGGRGWCRRLAAALVGGLVIYVAHHPSDSVAVEQGDALWFTAIALVLALCAHLGWPQANGSGRTGILSNVIDALVWILAAWMVIAALATCPPGNLRQATNEAWFWVAAAAVLAAVRRLMTARALPAEVFALVGGVAVALASQALFQEWFELPKLRQDYLSDPDAILRSAGIEAPRGSARRMVFANRLLDGGPTATFALANSLAGYLIAGVLLPLALFQLRRLSSPMAKGWLEPRSIALMGFAGLCVAAIFATRSRSALIAVFLGGLWVFLLPALNRRRGPSLGPSRRWRVMIPLACGVILAVVIGLMLFGDEEWMAAAPASLEFRLQYWRSTLALLADHPWFGAGPGGFQAMYLKYRLPIANETIADPHNFFFETLAAGGGVAGILLLSIIAAAALLIRTRSRVSGVQLSNVSEEEGREPAESEGFGGASGDPEDEPSLTGWCFAGAGIGLTLIWMFALATGRFPDMIAQAISVPLGAAAAWLLWAPGLVGRPAIRGVAGVGLAALLLHLSVSGGWTVPGVAVLIWLYAAAWFPVGSGDSRAGGEPSGRDPNEGGKASFSPRTLAVLIVGGALLVCLRFESILPVQQSAFSQMLADEAARAGRSRPADDASIEAVRADPWAFEPALWRSEYLTGGMVQVGAFKTGTGSLLREQWARAQAMALERAGENPLVIRSIAEQRLWVYQRWGRPEDLSRAGELLERALAGNPTDVSLLAQTAAVQAAVGDRSRASRLAGLASDYSLLGGNVVRKLELQKIYRPETLGSPAGGRPILESAETLLEGLDDRGEPDAPAVRSIRTEK